MNTAIITITPARFDGSLDTWLTNHIQVLTVQRQPSGMFRAHCFSFLTGRVRSLDLSPNCTLRVVLQ